MDKEVVYIAELDEDIDDVVAAHYLHNKGVLKCVVLDPYPKTKEGLERKEKLEAFGITVSKKIPPIAKYVFVGGALTLVADYIKMNHIDWLVMNGGFVGTNLAKHELDKFKGKETVRTFNFNCDVKATDTVLRSDVKHIGHVLLIGKNVCHDIRNTRKGIWKDDEYKALLDTYHVKEEKRLHDMLACHEGIAYIDGGHRFCEYDSMKPYNEGLCGTMTKWGSTKIKESPYRFVNAAVGFAD